MAAQGLSGFYGSVFKRSTVAFVLIRTSDWRILTLRAGAGSAGSGDWEFPGGVVKGSEDPRSAARRMAREALGFQLDVGRLLVMDCVQGSAGQGDSIAFVFDGGTLATSVTGFTGAGGEREARFFPVGECPDVLGGSSTARLGAALEALELGTVTELVDGRQVSGEPLVPPSSQRMMPPVDGFSGVLGH